VRLLVRVTPKSARDSVEGVAETVEGPALRVRVRALAEDGKANRAVEQVLAGWLGVAKTRVAVAKGDTSRVKTLFVSGETAALETLLARRLAGLT
jgi:uncharacterized protein